MPTPNEPRNLLHELEIIERELRRAEKQRQRQPRGKRLTADSYTALPQKREKRLTMDFLTTGSDYLARYPNFHLVGRDQELKRLTAVLMRNYANSVILVGAGGVGCTTLCVGIQAAKLDPDAPFDILNKRLFFLDADGLFSSGDTTEINHDFQRIITKLQTDEIGADRRRYPRFDRILRNNGTMHFINALLVAVGNKKIQIIFETKEEDLNSVLKCHSDLRELFTILPIEEPVNDALLAIVTEAGTLLGKHHGIEVTPEAITAAIEFTNRYHTKDAGLSRAQPERAITLLDRSLAAYRLSVHRKPPQYSDTEWAAKQAKMRTLNAERREGQSAISQLEDEIDAVLKHEREVASPEKAGQMFGGGF